MNISPLTCVTVGNLALFSMFMFGHEVNFGNAEVLDHWISYTIDGKGLQYAKLLIWIPVSIFFLGAFLSRNFPLICFQTIGCLSILGVIYIPYVDDGHALQMWIHRFMGVWAFYTPIFQLMYAMRQRKPSALTQIMVLSIIAISAVFFIMFWLSMVHIVPHKYTKLMEWLTLFSTFVAQGIAFYPFPARNVWCCPSRKRKEEQPLLGAWI